MADANGSTGSDSAEDCLVLLEELMRQKTRSCSKIKKKPAILQRIEERLHDREYVPRGGRHRSNPRRRSARNTTAVPAASRVSLIVKRNPHLN